MANKAKSGQRITKTVDKVLSFSAESTPMEKFHKAMLKIVSVPKDKIKR